jgi:phage terminase small subunit
MGYKMPKSSKNNASRAATEQINAVPEASKHPPEASKMPPNGSENGLQAGLRVEYRPLDALIPFARNPRAHSDDQVAQIAASIREFGFTNPILLDGGNGVIAGHGRLAAARQLGLQTVPCPGWIQPEARKAWNYLCGQLEKMGILGTSDQAIMVAYCQQWEIVVLATKRMQSIATERDRKAAEAAEKAGKEPPPGHMSLGDWSDAMLATTSNGNVINNPLLGVANAASERLFKCASLLGLSPTDRAKLTLEAPKGKTPREELLG